MAFLLLLWKLLFPPPPPPPTAPGMSLSLSIAKSGAAGADTFFDLLTKPPPAPTTTPPDPAPALWALDRPLPLLPAAVGDEGEF